VPMQLYHDPACLPAAKELLVEVLGDLAGVLAVIRERFRYLNEPPLSQQPEEQLDVLPIQHPLAETSCGVEGGTTHQHGRGWEKGMIPKHQQKLVVADVWRWVGPEGEIARGVHAAGVTRGSRRVALQGLLLQLQLPEVPVVIGVQEGQI